MANKGVTYRIRDAQSGWYVAANGVVMSPYFRTKKAAQDFLREYKAYKARNREPRWNLED